MSWDLKFYQPIRVPGKRKPLVTLRDAVKYMTSLPREEQNTWMAGTYARRRASRLSPAMTKTYSFQQS